MDIRTAYFLLLLYMPSYVSSSFFESQSLFVALVSDVGYVDMA